MAVRPSVSSTRRSASAGVWSGLHDDVHRHRRDAPLRKTRSGGYGQERKACAGNSEGDENRDSVCAQCVDRMVSDGRLSDVPDGVQLLGRATVTGAGTGRKQDHGGQGSVVSNQLSNRNPYLASDVH